MIEFLIFLSLCCILSYGGGNINVYMVGLSILLSIAVTDSILTHKTRLTIINILFSVLLIVWPNYGLLLGVLTCFLCINKRFRPTSLAILLFWCVQNVFCTIVPIYIAFLVVLISYGLYYFCMRYRGGFAIIMCLLSTVCFVTEIVGMSTRTHYEVETYNNSNTIYAPSKSFCRSTVSDSLSHAPIIRSYGMESTIPYTMAGVCILEHSPKLLNDVVLGGKWQQPVSWHSNLLVGSQYYLEAIVNDGGLWSNIGTNLKDTGDVRLAYRTYGNKQPLIVKLDSVLYLHDSDYTSAYLAHYQQSFIQELFADKINSRPYLVRGINLVGLMLGVFCVVFDMTTIWMSLFMCWQLFIVFVSIAPFQEGNLRMVGKICDSHENYRYDGVPKNLLKNGVDIKIGQQNAEILLVKEGHCTLWNNEHIIILEPRAKVWFRGHLIIADEIPSGYSYVSNNFKIEDSRKFFYKSSVYTSGASIIENNDTIMIIATGKPAGLDWNFIYQKSKK